MLKKRKTITGAGLSFFCRIKLINGEVVSRRSPIKLKVFNFIQARKTKFKTIYLLVTYKKGIYNDGFYRQNQYDEFLKAWQSFTEENLIKDALTY